MPFPSGRNLNYLVFSSLAILLSLIQSHDSDCPNLFDVDPNADSAGQLTGLERCFLDCTRGDAYDVICEDVDFVTLLANAKKIPFKERDLNVFIFNSPKITELDGGTFGPMRVHMKELGLMGLDHLTSFPMLKELDTLEILKIQNTPDLRQFSPEILPQNLQKLVLYGTAIQLLTVDLQETKELKKMMGFHFIKQKIRGIRKNFLTIFPNLKTAVFSGNHFDLDTVNDQLFAGKKPFEKFVMRGNNFSATEYPIRQIFMEKLMESMKIVDNGSLDLSYNTLPITKTAVSSFNTFNNVKYLNLAGNQFGQFFKATDLFANFTYLKTLDLSYSSLPKQSGIFSGLAELKDLNLRGNAFRNLNRVDLFAGCKAKLQRLDLSDNKLMTLPSGNFTHVTSSLTELILAGNTFHTELLDIDDLDSMPTPVSAHLNFSSLQFLDLGRTQLKTFKGVWLAGLTSLTRLDLSCNHFKNVTKEFFLGLPPSIEHLDLSFCVSLLPNVPKIQEDAFSTLGAPPENVTDGSSNATSRLTELVLSSGYLKGWIFYRLMALPKATRNNLKKLDLSNNQIRFLTPEHLQNFTKLESLNLGGNFIQTIGKGTFSGMTNLLALNLSSNHIVSVQREELVDLNNLYFLDLSDNGIVNLDHGAFDRLPALRELYLNRNSKITSMNGMFMDGGKNVVHLGLMATGLSLTTYPVGCIARTDLDPLPNLKYFYVDNSTAVYVDHGHEDGTWKDKLDNTTSTAAVRMLPNDPYALQCAFGNNLTNSQAQQSVDSEPGGSTAWSDDFIRLLIRNPLDLSPRTFVAHIPKCYSSSYRWVANVTSAFICPNQDAKTFDPKAPPPPSKN